MDAADPLDRVCLFCGDDFRLAKMTAHRPGRKRRYCSDDCRWAAHHQRRLVIIEARIRGRGGSGSA